MIFAETVIFDEHLARLLTLACLLLVEIAVRRWPTKLDRSLVNMIAKFVTAFFDYFVPNKTKGGKIITKVETLEQKDNE